MMTQVRRPTHYYSNGHKTPNRFVDEQGVEHRYCARGENCIHPQGPFPPTSDFSNNRRYIDGLTYICKACANKMMHDDYIRRTEGKIRRRRGMTVANKHHVVDNITVRPCASGDECLNPLQPNIPLDERYFYGNSGNGDGFSARCKLCSKARANKAYAGAPIPEVAAELPDYDFYTRRGGKKHLWMVSTVARFLGVSYLSVLHDGRYRDRMINYGNEGQVVVDELLLREIIANDQRDKEHRSELMRQKQEEEAARDQKWGIAPKEAVEPVNRTTSEFKFNAAIRGIRHVWRWMTGGMLVFKDDKLAQQFYEDVRDSGALDDSNGTSNGNGNH